MTKQEMRDFAQSQVEWYTKQIEWDRKQIKRINEELAKTRKDDKELAEYASAKYPDNEYWQTAISEGFKGEETKKLERERSKYYREIKKYQAHVEQYKQEVIKYTEAKQEAQEATNTNETKEEENTMKNTNKGMTKNEAIQSIAKLTGGTLARIFGSTKYNIIDDGINNMITTAAEHQD